MKTFKEYIKEKYVGDALGDMGRFSIYQNPSPREYMEILDVQKDSLYPRNFRFIIDQDGIGDLFAFSYKLFHSYAADTVRSKLVSNGDYAVFGEYDAKKNAIQIFYYNSEADVSFLMKRLKKNKYISRVLKKSYKVIQ